MRKESVRPLAMMLISICAAATAMACSVTTDGAPADNGGTQSDDDGGNGTGDDGGSTTNDGGAGRRDGGSKATDGGASALPVGTASIIVTDSRDFLIQGTSLYYAYGSVEKANLDGTSPTTVSGIASADAIATDGTRLYGLVHGSESAATGSITSVPLAGGAAISHAVTLNDPQALSIGGGYIYFTYGEDDPPHGLARLATSAVNGTPQTVGADLNGAGIFPVFGGGLTFALDHGDPVELGETRAYKLWAFDGVTGTGIAPIPLSSVTYDGSLAVDDSSVYARGGGDLKSFLFTSGAGANGTTIISGTDCPLDGANTQMSLAIDGSDIYTACNSATDESLYEVRKYSKSGTLEAIIATSPKVQYGWLVRLTVAGDYVYWQSEDESNQMPIYRASKNP